MSSGWIDYTEPFDPHIHKGVGMRTSAHSGAPGVVRLDRTFSDFIFTGDRRSAGCICTRSMRFSNHFSAEKARCVEIYYMSSGWFGEARCACSRTSSSQRYQGI